jgi:hypothetical protein
MPPWVKLCIPPFWGTSPLVKLVMHMFPPRASPPGIPVEFWGFGRCPLSGLLFSRSIISALRCGHRDHGDTVYVGRGRSSTTRTLTLSQVYGFPKSTSVFILTNFYFLTILPAKVSVLIVGGGGSGLSSAVQLSDLGIDSLLTERRVVTSHMPKAGAHNQGTMEIWRRHGIADQVQEIGMPPETRIRASWMASLGGDDELNRRELFTLDVNGEEFSTRFSRRTAPNTLLAWASNSWSHSYAKPQKSAIG